MFPRAVAIVMLLVALGCASTQLPDDASQVEKRAAACLDAQAALAMADAALSNPEIVDRQTVAYWSAFRAGAVVGISAYCGVPK